MTILTDGEVDVARIQRIIQSGNKEEVRAALNEMIKRRQDIAGELIRIRTSQAGLGARNLAAKAQNAADADIRQLHIRLQTLRHEESPSGNNERPYLWCERYATSDEAMTEITDLLDGGNRPRHIVVFDGALFTIWERPPEQRVK